MNIKDQIKNKQEESNKLDYYNLRRGVKLSEEFKKIISSFSELDDIDKNFNTLRESFIKFKTMLKAEIEEILNKISQIDKDSDEAVECISELTEYVLCLSSLLYMIVKIQIKINMFEYNICQAKPNVTIDNLALIVIKKFYDLVSEIKNSMYEYCIRFPEKYSAKYNYTPSNNIYIKKTYEEIMEQLNKIMGDVSVNKDVYKRLFSERFISSIEVWRKHKK